MGEAASIQECFYFALETLTKHVSDNKLNLS